MGQLGVDTGCCLPGKVSRYAADLLNLVPIIDQIGSFTDPSPAPG